MQLNTFLRTSALTLALVCSVKSANAAPIVFADVDSFRAAAGPTSVLTFDDLTTGAVTACLPASPYVPDPCELDYGGATFVATLGRLHSGGQRPLLFALGMGLQPSNGMMSGEIPLDADDFFFTFQSNAVGFSIWGGGRTPVGIQVEDVDGQTFDYTVTADAFVAPFFGLVSDVALNRVSLYAVPYINEYGFLGTGNLSIDDVELQDVDLQAVPEPSSLALMLGGLAVVARRRRRAKS